MHEVATILLAAGLSKRMGEIDKQLLPINDRPMIVHMVETYSSATEGPVIVVTGHARKRVESALRGTKANVVFCEDYDGGQAKSVATGLQQAPDAKSLLIGLGDQPLLTSDDVRALLEVHNAVDPSKISIPKIGEARGNPIVVPRTLREQLLADPLSPGCRRFTRQNPQHVQFHVMQSQGFFHDVDTPEEYAAVLLQLEKEKA